MSLLSRPHRVALAAGTIGLALVASACASTDAKPSAGGGSASAAPECAAFTQYGNHAGKTVSIYSPIRDAEADLFEQAWKPFADVHRNEDRLRGLRRVRGSDPGPGRRRQPARHRVLPAARPAGALRQGRQAQAGPAEVETLAEEDWSADWTKYGTVDGTSTAPRWAPA